MATIPTDVLVQRRVELLAEVDRLNVRINEIERWLQFAATDDRVVVGAPISPAVTPIVTQARSPRAIAKEQTREKQ